MKNVETKYFDTGAENVQLYHNTGLAGGAHVYPVVFNPWNQIASGTGRQMRVGDIINPRGLLFKGWISNKLDRPNVNYRIVVCVMPRMLNGAVVTAASVDPAPPFDSGACGNYTLLPWDKEKGIKVLYDKVIKITSPWGDATGNTQKECSRDFKFFIKRKNARPIKFDTNFNILNNPLSIYIIPYDAYGSLTTDNIASCAFMYRMYWKDP